MVSKIFTSIGFSLCGLLFSILILMMYFSKKKEKYTYESSIFAAMIIFTIFLLLLEIVYVFCMSSTGFMHRFTEFACRTYLLGVLAWMLTFSYYVLLSGTRHIEPIERKKSLRKKILYSLIATMVITSIISCVSPINYAPYVNDVYAFGGAALNIVYFVGVVLVLVILYVLLVRNLEYPVEQRTPIYFTYFLMIIMLVTQLITKYDYNTITFVFAGIIATTYFTVESQDYKLMNELEKSKDEALIADRAKTEFLTNMSHAIRTPLNTILGFSAVLYKENKLQPDIVKRDVSSIHDAAIILLDLINNILDISRIESNKETIINNEYDLQTLAFELNSVFMPKLISPDVSFVINVDENLPKKYYGDYSKIYKSILNILINAVHHTTYGKIILDIHKKETNDGNFTFEIVISNSGHSMLEKNFNMNFNDYVSLNNDYENNIDSVSLGLIISKRLISMMGGEIEFKNENGKGTRYIITLSQQVVSEEKVGNIFEHQISDNLDDLIDLSNKKILIVDDNAINIKLATRLLEGYKPIIDSADSGSKCLELVSNNKYDIIFLDHMMPEMDGIMTLKALYSLGKKLPPIIALTANSSDGVKEKYITAGFDDYLSKPIDHRELKKIIFKYFGNK